MAWVTPITFASNDVLTASDLNNMLNTNMNETAPAKATQAGSYFASDGANSIVERQPLTARANGLFTTTSTSFVSAPDGPEITFDHSGSFLVIYTARLYSTSGVASMTPGTNATSPQLADSVRNSGGFGNLIRAGAHNLFTGFSAGEETVDLKYLTSSGTGSFGQRELIVFPF